MDDLVKIIEGLSPNEKKLVHNFVEALARKKVPAESLWQNRDKTARKSDGSRITPVDWVQMHYGNKRPGEEWQAEGLTRADLNKDRPLYDAYVKRIKRLPEEDLYLLVQKRAKIADPEETLERKRAAYRRFYQKQKTSTPHPSRG